MNLSARDRRAIIVGLALLAALGLARFALWPWLDHWRGLRAEHRTAQERLTRLERRVRHLDQLEGRLRETHGPGVGRTLQGLDRTRVTFPQTVQTILEASGFNGEAINAQSARKAGRIKGVLLVPLQIRGKCDIGQLARLLAEARKTDVLVLVDRLQVDANPQKRAELNVNVVLATLALEPPKR